MTAPADSIERAASLSAARDLTLQELEMKAFFPAPRKIRGPSTVAGHRAEACLRGKGIEGDATEDTHDGWSELLSYDISVQNSGWPGGTGLLTLFLQHVRREADRSGFAVLLVWRLEGGGIRGGNDRCD